MPQPETPTARVTAEDIPTSVTQLVYTAPPIDENHNGKPLHLSQNKTAEVLAHYWPAIEAHFREQVASEIENHPGPIPFRPQRDETGGFWWDTRDRDAAASIARRTAAAMSAPGGEPVAPACRCGADPVHQMGCDAEWADQ